MSVAETIRKKLTDCLSPTGLEIIDESRLHAGHAGARKEGESHFRIKVVSNRFEGLSRIARQRLVNDALREELAGPIHALVMTTLTPKEAAD